MHLILTFFFLLIIINFHPPKKGTKMARLGSQITFLVLKNSAVAALESCTSRAEVTPVVP